MMKFQTTRKDGRSNARVVIDFVKNAAAGHLFTYDELSAALSKGSNRKYGQKEITRIIGTVYPRLLKEHARALHSVRGIGYRIAPAGYHLELASDRQTRADRQMLRGVQTLENVRWDEMDANQRMAHEGQLLITGALYRQMKALERRQSAVERAIKRSRGGDLLGDGDTVES